MPSTHKEILINNFIDHTLLKSTASKDEIRLLCKEAIEHKFYAVCVNGSYVKLAKNCLQGSAVKVASVVGFPLGATSTKSKVEEAINAVADGADEIDMVINIGDVKSNAWFEVQSEIDSIKAAIGNAVLKVIIETCYLTEDEIIHLSLLLASTNADYIKTSTGFGTGGATIDNIKLIKYAIDGSHLQIKASGGVKDLKTAMQYIKLGVNRIGTSSGVGIVQEFHAANINS